MIVLVVTCPTPHHTPVHNRLYDLLGELGEELRVFYLFGDDERLFGGGRRRSWGRVTVTHPYVVLDHPRGWAAFANALRCPQLRAVHVCGYRGAARVAAAVTARTRRVPLVLRGEANVRDERARPALRRLAKRWYLRALLGQSEIWSNGSANTAYWRMLGLRRLHTIPYALPHLPGNESGGAALRADLEVADRFVYAFVGRLESFKGIADLLHAYDLVREATPREATALVIAGPGPLRPEVRRYAGAHRDCHYLDGVPQDRLGAVYAAADVLVVPSHREPWGWVVNEALGFGTRVIASEEVAAADDLCTEVTGRRCPAADPGALAAAMVAEYREGPRPAPRLACVDTAGVMVNRLRELALPPAERAV